MPKRNVREGFVPEKTPKEPLKKGFVPETPPAPPPKKSDGSGKGSK